jgi:hypothetical protein
MAGGVHAERNLEVTRREVNKSVEPTGDSRFDQVDSRVSGGWLPLLPPILA